MNNDESSIFFIGADLYYRQNVAAFSGYVSRLVSDMYAVGIRALSYPEQINRIADAVKIDMRNNGKYDKQSVSLPIRWYTEALIKVMNMPNSKAEEIFCDIFRKCFPY